MKFTLIVPPTIETAITGFVGAGARDYRGKSWRADLYAGEVPRLSCDGKPVSLASAPRHAIELVIAFQKSRSSCNNLPSDWLAAAVIAFQKSRSSCNSTSNRSNRDGLSD